MGIPRTIIFVDGENLVFRYQDMLSQGRLPATDTFHIPDIFVWHPQVSEWCYMHLIRVYGYTSMVGDDVELIAKKDLIAKMNYRFHYDNINQEQLGKGQIIPIVFKKSARSHKSRQVDIQIIIDMMRFAHNPSIDSLYLLSGDGDYLPIIQEVMRHGKEVTVGAFSSGLAKELCYCVDSFCKLDDIFFQDPNKQLDT